MEKGWIYLYCSSTLTAPATDYLNRNDVHDRNKLCVDIKCNFVSEFNFKEETFPVSSDITTEIWTVQFDLVGAILRLPYGLTIQFKILMLN